MGSFISSRRSKQGSLSVPLAHKLQAHWPAILGLPTWQAHAGYIQKRQSICVPQPFHIVVKEGALHLWNPPATSVSMTYVDRQCRERSSKQGDLPHSNIKGCQHHTGAAQQVKVLHKCCESLCVGNMCLLSSGYLQRVTLVHSSLCKSFQAAQSPPLS